MRDEDVISEEDLISKYGSVFLIKARLRNFVTSSYFISLCKPGIVF